MDEIEVLAVWHLSRKAKNRIREMWVHPVNKGRGVKGTYRYTFLYKELRDDSSNFFNYFRKSPYSFEELLVKIWQPLGST